MSKALALIIPLVLHGSRSSPPGLDEASVFREFARALERRIAAPSRGKGRP
jgi:hypothetical protein